MYADDTSIYASGADVNTINNHLNDDLCRISEWFKSNLLVINESKASCMLICTSQKRHRLATDKLSLYINKSMINNVARQNVLGVMIDNSLKFDFHVDNICKKMSKLMFLLSKVNSYLPYDAKILFYNSYVIPCLDYCMIVWGYASKMNLDKLFRYQKRIGRLILNDYACDSLELFDRLGWLTIYERRDLITLKQVYKCLYHQETPSSLKSLFSLRTNTRQLPLRNTGLDLHIPKVDSEFRKKCLDFVGTTLWNNLPQEIRSASSIELFKQLAQKYLKSIRII